MVEILRNKNLATRFQILVEIADGGPNIQQREIARNLKVTPQAISDYIAQLTKEGLLASDGRSRYKVTNEGVNWIIKVLRELRGYSAFIEKAITNISVCPAIAECDLVKGQTVGLKMKDGLLLATDSVSEGAKGTVVTDARKGEDTGVTGIEGIVALETGKVTILRVPGIQKGGSRKIDINRLQKEVKDRPVIATKGIEAIVALKKADARFYMYGAVEAAIEAANSGLNPLVACVEDETSALIRRLEAEKISYELLDIEKD
jgi:putative transcriptional regulator